MWCTTGHPTPQGSLSPQSPRAFSQGIPPPEDEVDVHIQTLMESNLSQKYYDQRDVSVYEVEFQNKWKEGGLQGGSMREAPGLSTGPDTPTGRESFEYFATDSRRSSAAGAAPPMSITVSSRPSSARNSRSSRPSSAVTAKGAAQQAFREVARDDGGVEAWVSPRGSVEVMWEQSDPLILAPQSSLNDIIFRQ